MNEECINYDYQTATMPYNPSKTNKQVSITTRTIGIGTSYADSFTITLQNQNQQLQKNWNELKEYLKKQIIDLEIKREDISADYYIDRKLFLKEVLNKIQELEGRE